MGVLDIAVSMPSWQPKGQVDVAHIEPREIFPIPEFVAHDGTIIVVSDEDAGQRRWSALRLTPMLGPLPHKDGMA